MATVAHIDATSTVRIAEHTYQLTPAAPRMGPYIQAGNVFVVVQDPTGNTIQVWESVDGGVTFAEADAANHPACAPDVMLGDNKREYGVARNGTTLYIAYMAPDATVHVSAFNLTTATWGADFGGGPALGTEPTLYLSYNPVAGTLRLVFQDGLVVPIQWVDVTLVGAWGAAANVITGTALILDGTGESMAGAAWYTNVIGNRLNLVTGRRDLVHCSIDSAGAVGTVQVVAAGYAGSQDPADFLGSGTVNATTTDSTRVMGLVSQALVAGQKIVITYGVRTFLRLGGVPGAWNYVAVLEAITADPAADPVWAAPVELYRATTPSLGGVLPQDTQGSAAYYDCAGTLHVAYHLRLPDPALHPCILQMDFVGGVWGAPYALMTLTAAEFAAGIDGYWAISGGCDATGTGYGIIFGKGDSNIFNPGLANVAQADPYYLGEGAPVPPPTVSCNNPPTGTVGVAYTHTLTAAGGTPPYTFAIVGGALPPGLALTGATGVIAGVPTTAGTYTFTVRVTDAAAQTAQVECSILIVAAPVPPVAPPQPTGRGGGGYPAPRPFNAYDHCLLEWRGWYARVCKLVCPKPRPLVTGWPWDEEDGKPADSTPFWEKNAILTPLPASGDVTVIDFRVPFGWDGAITQLYAMYTGAGFVQGSGDIVWRIRLNGYYARDFGNIPYLLGTAMLPMPLTDAIPLISGQRVQMIVSVPNLSGLIQVQASLVLGGLIGLYYPR